MRKKTISCLTLDRSPVGKNRASSQITHSPSSLKFSPKQSRACARAYAYMCVAFSPFLCICIQVRVSCKAKSIRHSIAFPPRSLGGRGTCDLFSWPIYELRDTIRRCDSKWKIEPSPGSFARRGRSTKYVYTVSALANYPLIVHLSLFLSIFV